MPPAGILAGKEANVGNCRRSGNGGTQTCLPAACGVAQGVAQYDPSSSTQAQDPREGPSLTGRTTGSFLRHGLVRLAHEEAERSRRGTSRGARNASHDDQGAGGRQADAGLCRVLVSPLVQRGKHRPKASDKGYRFGATRPRLVERQDGGHRGAQDNVIVRAFGSRRPTLVRISVLDVPLQNGQVLAPFSHIIWEEAQGLHL